MYEPNVLNAFVENYSQDKPYKLILGERRSPREDGIFTDQKTGRVFSAELTKITNQSIEEKNAYLVSNFGVGEAYSSYSTKEAIEAIKRKVEKYEDHETRILVLDAFSSVSFEWEEYRQPAMDYARSTPFFAIYAIQSNKGGIKSLPLRSRLVLTSSHSASVPLLSPTNSSRRISQL